MKRKSWGYSLSLNISCVNRRIAAVSLAVLLLLSASPPRGGVTAALRLQQDEKAATAQKLYDEGFQYYQRRTAEDLRRAIKKYEEALSLWRELGNRAKQALVLISLGRANDDLEEKQKALDLYIQALLLCRAIGERYGEATTLINIGAVYSA